MEGKAAAEGAQSNASAPAVASQTMDKEEATRSMQQLKEETIRCAEQHGPIRGNMPAWVQWAGIKSKVRGFGEYAILRTRQGISMFGEPKLESMIKGAAAEDEPQ